MGWFKRFIRGFKRKTSMDKVKRIILHYSASSNPAHNDVSVIDTWHKERGWSGCGYHFFVKYDGTIQKGRDEKRQGAHCKGNNRNTLGICMHGNGRHTAKQLQGLDRLLVDLYERYDLSLEKVYLHKELRDTSCCTGDIEKHINLKRTQL